MQHLHQDAQHLLTSWTPSDPDQVRLRMAYLDFLQEYPQAMQREHVLGHLTASALVVNPTRTHALLTLHPKVGRWLQLGGHLEATDVSVREAAHREVVEECGLVPTEISEFPVQLDRHAVPCAGGRSEHLDVQFLAVVDDGVAPRITDESLDLQWFALTELPNSLDPSVQTLITRAQMSES
jgi:8-oxo-dGTP pyrophosphatase MutT (NUDIX family)